MAAWTNYLKYYKRWLRLYPEDDGKLRVFSTLQIFFQEKASLSYNGDVVVGLPKPGMGLAICPKSSSKGVRITVTNTVENLPLPEIGLEEYQPKEANE